KRISAFWLLQLGGWGGYAIVLFSTNYPFQTRDVMVFLGITFVGELAASFFLRFACRRQWRLGLRFPRSLIVILAWCTVGAYLIATASLIGYQSSRDWLTSWSRLLMLSGDLPSTVRIEGVLISWCALYFGIKYYEALQAERRRVLVAESSAREAELRALRYQIHPHFLFNTLNAISTLILEGQGETATSMIARLADFLRVTLEGKAAHEVPLSEELF